MIYNESEYHILSLSNGTMIEVTTQKLLRNTLVVYLVPTVMLDSLLSNEKTKTYVKEKIFKKRVEFFIH